MVSICHFGRDRASGDTWAFVPRIPLPILDARLWSALDVTKVQREIAVAEYEKVIQTAFREVAGALAVRGTMDRRLAAQQSLMEASSETYPLSQARFKKGIDSFLSVLDAQRLAKIASPVRLCAVLGGGSEPDGRRRPTAE